jgi:2-keto-4-pentenoate hydratase/2-oxohepta-3-ene-1,7-dioic acid hydratase in catechol pathway
MKIVRFLANGKIKYGILKGQYIQAITGKPFNSIKYSGEQYKNTEVKLIVPCLPSKIVALGVNYVSHAVEMNHSVPTVPKSPLIFIKPATAVIGPDENIIYPPSSQQVDYEAELGIVIKKIARQIKKENALDYVLGYVCFNDVTARDQQKTDGQWTRAKSYDTFAPLGPWIETELDPNNVNVEAYLNGELKQHGNTSDLVFPITELIYFISNVMTLLPGDVIATGTPGGIGPMQPGDTIEIKIPPIGTLKNYVSRQND